MCTTYMCVCVRIYFFSLVLRRNIDNELEINLVVFCCSYDLFALG